MRFALAAAGACLAVACGGKPAAAPSSVAAVSHLTMTADDGKVDATGRAFAIRGANSGLTIAVFGSDTSPTPTCDTLKTQPPQLNKGSVLIVGMTGFKEATGKLDVLTYAHLATDGGGAMSMGGGGGESPSGSVLTITTLTKDTLDGVVEAGKSGPASGDIHATICSGIALEMADSPLPGASPAPPPPPPPPSTPPDSKVTLASKKGKLEINGHGFAWSDARGLNVTVVDDKTTPPASCDTIANLVPSNGAVFGLLGEGFAGKPGKLKVLDHSFIAVGDSASLDTEGADASFGSVLTITKATADSVDATIAPKKKGMKTLHVSGHIHAALCAAPKP